MNKELEKEMYDIYVKGFEGLDFKLIRKNNYDIIYNPEINDCNCNFISNFQVKNKEEFKSIIKEADKFFNEINIKTTVCVTPYMEELYNSREKYFNKSEYELISTEAWQVYDDFSKLDDINTNCNLNVKLELATNMEEYADCVLECYQTGDEEDPYGDLGDGYRQGYINYKGLYNDINNEFYYIKVNNEIVGTTQSLYNQNVYGIFSLAIKKEFRSKGIGKEVLKQQLKMCKEKNINTAFLQTELGFYPNKMYTKFGFKDLCIAYYYQKIK